MLLQKKRRNSMNSHWWICSCVRRGRQQPKKSSGKRPFSARCFSTPQEKKDQLLEVSFPIGL